MNTYKKIVLLYILFLSIDILLYSQSVNDSTRQDTLIISNFYHYQVQDQNGQWKDTMEDYVGVYRTLIYDSIERRYKVIDIQEYKEFNQNLYLIHIEDESGTYGFTILSFRNTGNNCKNKLKIGEYYKLILLATEDDQVVRSSYDSVVELIISGKRIFLPEYIKKYKIVTSPDIIGLCYIKHTKL